jgi:hypothetical protein
VKGSRILVEGGEVVQRKNRIDKIMP